MIKLSHIFIFYLILTDFTNGVSGPKMFVLDRKCIMRRRKDSVVLGVGMFLNYFNGDISSVSTLNFIEDCRDKDLCHAFEGRILCCKHCTENTTDIEKSRISTQKLNDMVLKAYMENHFIKGMYQAPRRVSK